MYIYTYTYTHTHTYNRITFLYTLYSIVNQLYFNKKFKKKKKQPHLSLKSHLPKSYHQCGTTPTLSFTQQTLISCLLVSVTIRARSDLRGHKCNLPTIQMGRLEPRDPGQAPLPIPVCLFNWQCPYSHSELPVEVTGFFPGDKMQPSRTHTAPPEAQVSGYSRQ